MGAAPLFQKEDTFMADGISRRSFLSKSSAGVLALGSGTRAGSSSANDRVAVGVIGVRGMGLGHVKRLLERQDASVAALCDVDRKMVERAGETVRQATGKSPRMVGDFRRLLDDKSIDA